MVKYYLLRMKVPSERVWIKYTTGWSVLQVHCWMQCVASTLLGGVCCKYTAGWNVLQVNCWAEYVAHTLLGGVCCNYIARWSMIEYEWNTLLGGV